MSLSEEQKQAVASWIEAGEGLSDVQERVASEFGISMTYMDVRFLVDDIGASLQDKEVAEPQPTPDQSSGPEPTDALAPGDDVAMEEPAPSPAGSLKVELDRITRPGAAVSGTVVFSDGITASWEVDQSGRLALRASQEGYKPSPADIETFQRQLSSMFQQRGY